MTKQELFLLVSKGEGQYLEFKTKVDHPDKIVKEVVAFANSGGGRLLIGVEDDGKISGLKYADEEAFEMAKAIQNLCKPTIKFSLEKIALNEKKQILVYSFKESKKKPHYAVEDTKTGLGKAYVRVEDKSVQASKELKLILKGQRFRKKISFEFGENERAVMKLLESKERFTLKEFINHSGVSYKVASATVITLVLSNVLTIIPSEKEDFYKLREY